MTTMTDIGNRALQLLGTRTNMASLGESSNEAAQISLVSTAIVNWCLGLSNWNFARATTTLTLSKGPAGLNPGTWTTSKVTPPWLYEYLLPSDFIKAIYVTNMDAGTTAGWMGEPKRFVISMDFISGAQQEVLLTNEAAPIFIYTAYIADPTHWPWFFERLVVYALAVSICMALTGDKKLLEELSMALEQQINIAVQANQGEGLMIGDNTPEWIQATGISFPYRRLGMAAPTIPQLRQPRNARGDQ